MKRVGTTLHSVRDVFAQDSTTKFDPHLRDQLRRISRETERSELDCPILLRLRRQDQARQHLDCHSVARGIPYIRVRLSYHIEFGWTVVRYRK